MQTAITETGLEGKGKVGRQASCMAGVRQLRGSNRAELPNPQQSLWRAESTVPKVGVCELAQRPVLCVCTCVRGSCPGQAASHGAPQAPFLSEQSWAPRAKECIDGQQTPEAGSTWSSPRRSQPRGRPVGFPERMCFCLWCFVKVAPGPSSSAPNLPRRATLCSAHGPDRPSPCPTPRLHSLCGNLPPGASGPEKRAVELLLRALSKQLTSGSGQFPGAVCL